MIFRYFGAKLRPCITFETDYSLEAEAQNFNTLHTSQRFESTRGK